MCAVTTFRVRSLPSVKRTPSRFYFVKSYPFLNPPSALRPISENLPDRGGLTRGDGLFVGVIGNQKLSLRSLASEKIADTDL